MLDMEIIRNFKNNYRFLSNFFEPVDIYFEGELYSSVEAAYQAAKTLRSAERRKFTNLSAKDSKREGKKISLRPDWEDVKVRIMSALVWQKFAYHEELGKKLVETFPVELIEGNTWGDKFWGVCNGEGENMHGKILMEVRLRLRDPIIAATVSSLRSVMAIVEKGMDKYYVTDPNATHAVGEIMEILERRFDVYKFL